MSPCASPGTPHHNRLEKWLITQVAPALSPNTTGDEGFHMGPLEGHIQPRHASWTEKCMSDTWMDPTTTVSFSAYSFLTGKVYMGSKFTPFLPAV